MNTISVVLPTLLAMISVSQAIANDEKQTIELAQPDFAKHIQPLLAKKCVSCHGREKQKAGS